MGFEEEFKQINDRLAALEQGKADVLTVKEMVRNSWLAPTIDRPTVDVDAPFMQHSSCTASDFLHPRYFAMCRLINARPYWHRKQWEYVFILHHLTRAGVLRSGMRGLGFGVGVEPLPSAFALLGASVTGTDAPDEIRESGGWAKSKEHSQTLEDMRFPWIAEDRFRELVSYQPCDMMNIDPALTGYDFTWSSCCLEHLGNLQNGLDFVRNSVENCLKVGGVAVHTTELNLTSDIHTIEEDAGTVIYRRSDLTNFIAEMEERGHIVEPFIVGPPAHQLDYHVDVAPYSEEPHLRLRIAEYASTSCGLVIRRGA